MRFKYLASVTAGLISAAVIGYSLLAPIWDFPLADKITSTGSAIVLVISMVLSVFTGQKLSKEMTPAGMLEKISTDEVFERTYSAGQLMSDEKAKEVYVEELPLVKIGYVKSPKHSL